MTHICRGPIPTRLYRKADGDKAVLAYLAHVLLDDRHGLVHGACVTAADSYAEREAPRWLLEASGCRRGTVGADRGYNVPNLVAAVRRLALTPHVAMKVQSTLSMAA